MAQILRWKDATRLPVEAGSLRPDALSGLTAADVARLNIPHGNAPSQVGELFDVEGDLGDGHLIFEGSLQAVRAIGAGISSGRLTVRGDVGPRAALGMSGGEVRIEGTAGSWAGAEMTGGLLRITGDAGFGVGAALPGSQIGMRGGIILVNGSVGEDSGLAMRRGLIAVGRGAGVGFGRALVAGSAFAFGPVGMLAGMGMKRGTIALFGQHDPNNPGILPSFAPSGRDRPPFLTIYLRKLVELGFEVPISLLSGTLARYNGDQSARGQGEILVWG
jgi:formylmethanofuran dehydrogenase subunit C